MKLSRRSTWLNPGQLEIPIERQITPDRNAHKGGRSFYFFDFDDNIAFLSTPIILFEKGTGREKAISSADYAASQRWIGHRGAYHNYEIRLDDQTGSFRNFRDRDLGLLERLMGRKQIFVRDLAHALGLPDVAWKGPSWSCFFHATLNQRPLSLITARGHSPETLKQGLRILVDRGFLPSEPNYLSVFPVSHPPTRQRLGCKTGRTPVSDLKRAAIRASVEAAIEQYGESDHHRFGMSDDDPVNIQMITEEMVALKAKYPKMSFFVIETDEGRFVKWEVFKDGPGRKSSSTAADFQSFEQLTLGIITDTVE